MQATLVLYQIIHHPGSGGTAGNEHDVASASSPTIPEIFPKNKENGRFFSFHHYFFITYLSKRLMITYET